MRAGAGLDLNGVFRVVFVLFFVLFGLFSCTSLPKRKTKRNPKSSKTAFRSSPALGSLRGPPGTPGSRQRPPKKPENQPKTFEKPSSKNLRRKPLGNRAGDSQTAQTEPAWLACGLGASTPLPLGKCRGRHLLPGGAGRRRAPGSRRGQGRVLLWGPRGSGERDRWLLLLLLLLLPSLLNAGAPPRSRRSRPRRAARSYG